ncbi:ECF transporter S component [Brevibacillus fulvus]|uniref:Energy-coupling factor transport system substrate-specific component n=1 Tax=Brevibacillus fulvus TaxID=1125967 RepID=A0A939BU15_9BACL|nr:ECF transporter S component [Brevibacillus fulvus]MBM7590044.1 energy-coupling factor transport system substrate-specific component [Brevibacillus fulvus]
MAKGAFRLTTLGIVMIPVAVGINFIGKQLANTLNLPIWLDSIGTILSAVIAGPWIGAISGFVNNLFFGLTMDGGLSIWYGISSIAIAMAAGVLAALGWFRSLPKAIVAGIIVAIVSAIVSTPINVLLWGGQTGKAWGDLLFGMLIGNGVNIWLASFIDELLLDLFDKVVVAALVYFIALGLPKRLTQGIRSAETAVRK